MTFTPLLAPVNVPDQIKLGLPETPQAERPKQTVTYERRTVSAEKRPIPAEVFANVPVVETIELVPDEVKAEPEAFEQISEERTFEVELIGPKLVKREFVRPKYRRKGDRDQAPVMAPALPRVAAGGYASAGLIAYIVISKYQHHLPLYAGPGIKRPMPGDGLCRVGAGGASTAVAQHPA